MLDHLLEDLLLGFDFSDKLLSALSQLSINLLPQVLSALFELFFPRLKRVDHVSHCLQFVEVSHGEVI